MFTYKYIFQVEEKSACENKIKPSISHLKHKRLYLERKNSYKKEQQEQKDNDT